MRSPENTPVWLMQGATYVLPKNSETRNRKNYRPITCLTTMYKLLTSILTERIYHFLDKHNILPLEQKGCRGNSYGCKDQLLINRMLLENCSSKNRNLSTAWIDYRKAFDSVPHPWIEKALDIYKISPIIKGFLHQCMSMWSTKLILNHSNGTETSGNIKIDRGIFQGDSLSPLLFCLALVPWSSELNNTKYGYKIFDKTITHLFYMDDLKLYAKNDGDLEGLLATVKRFSDDINMEFGLDKCTKATFKRGRLTSTTSITFNDNTKIKDLDQGGAYKYLGVNEGKGIQHNAMKEKIRKEYHRRIRSIMKTELNSRNRIQAINSLAVPVV